MSERSYTKAVEKELIQAAQTAAVREAEKRIKDIADIAARWKKGRLAADAALESIRQTANAPAASWLSEADPGVPVAHGISMGLLTRKDLSAKAWKAVEVLVTLAEM